MAFNSEIEFEFLLLNADFSVEEFYNYEDNTIKTRIIINNPNNIISYQTWTSSSSHINGQDRIIIPLNGYNFVKMIEMYNAGVTDFLKYKPSCVLRVGDQKYFLTVEDFKHSGSSLDRDGSDSFKNSISNSNGISFVCINNFTDLNENRNGKRMQKVPEGQHNGKFNFSPLKFKHIDHNDVLKTFFEDNGRKYINHDMKSGKKYGMGSIEHILYHAMSVGQATNERATDYNFILEDNCDISLKNEKTTVITIKNPKMISVYEDWNEDSGKNNNHAKRDYSKITAAQLVQHIDKFNNNTKLGHSKSTYLHKFKPTVYLEVSTDQGVMPFISIIKKMTINHNSLDVTSLTLMQEMDTILTIELENNRLIDPNGNNLSNPSPMTNKKIFMNIDSASAGIDINDTMNTYYSVGCQTLGEMAVGGYVDLNGIFGMEGLTETVDDIVAESDIYSTTQSSPSIIQKSLPKPTPRHSTRPSPQPIPVKGSVSVKKVEPVKRAYTTLEKMLLDDPIDTLVERKHKITYKTPQLVISKEDDVSLPTQVASQPAQQSEPIVTEDVTGPPVFNFKVIVDENGVFVLDGEVAPVLRFSTKCKYVFDQSDPSNAGNRIIFGRENGKNDYLSHNLINSKALPGTQYSNVTFYLNENTETSDLFYYSKGKPNSGNAITIIQQFTIRGSLIPAKLWIALVGMFYLFNLNENRKSILLLNARSSTTPSNSKAIRQRRKELYQDSANQPRIYISDIARPFKGYKQFVNLQVRGNTIAVYRNSYLKEDTKEEGFFNIDYYTNNPTETDNIYLTPQTKKPISISPKHYEIMKTKIEDCKYPNLCFVKIRPSYLEQSQYDLIKEVYFWNALPIVKKQSKDLAKMVEINGKSYPGHYYINTASINSDDGVKKLIQLTGAERSAIQNEIDFNGLNIDNMIQENISHFDTVTLDNYYYPVNCEIVIPLDMLTDRQIDYYMSGKPGGEQVLTIKAETEEDFNKYFEFPKRFVEKGGSLTLEKIQDHSFMSIIKTKGFGRRTKEDEFYTSLLAEKTPYFEPIEDQLVENMSYVEQIEDQLVEKIPYDETIQYVEPIEDQLVENMSYVEQIEDQLVEKIPYDEQIEDQRPVEPLDDMNDENYIEPGYTNFSNALAEYTNFLNADLNTVSSNAFDTINSQTEQVLSDVLYTFKTPIGDNVQSKSKGGHLNVKMKVDGDPVYDTGTLPGLETAVYQAGKPVYYEAGQNLGDMYSKPNNARTAKLPKQSRPVLRATVGQARQIAEARRTNLRQTLGGTTCAPKGKGIFSTRNRGDCEDFVEPEVLEQLAARAAAATHDAVSQATATTVDGRPAREVALPPSERAPGGLIIRDINGESLVPKPGVTVGPQGINSVDLAPVSIEPEYGFTQGDLRLLSSNPPPPIPPRRPVGGGRPPVRLLGLDECGVNSPIPRSKALAVMSKADCDGIQEELQQVEMSTQEIENYVNFSVDTINIIEYLGPDAASLAVDATLEENFEISPDGEMDTRLIDDVSIQVGVEAYVGQGVLSQDDLNELTKGFNEVLSSLGAAPDISIQVVRDTLNSRVKSYAEDNPNFNDVLNKINKTNGEFSINELVDHVVLTSLVKNEVRPFTNSLNEMSKLLSDPDGIQTVDEYRQVVNERFGDEMADVYDRLTTNYGMTPEGGFSAITGSVSDAVQETNSTLLSDEINMTNESSLAQVSYESYDTVLKSSLRSQLELRLPEGRIGGGDISSSFAEASVEVVKKLNSTPVENINNTINDINRALNESREIAQEQGGIEVGDAMAEAIAGKGKSFTDEMKRYGLDGEAAHDKLMSEMAKSSEQAMQKTMKAINEGSLPDFQSSTIKTKIETEFRSSLESNLKGSLDAQHTSYKEAIQKQETEQERIEGENRRERAAEKTSLELFP